MKRQGHRIAALIVCLGVSATGLAANVNQTNVELIIDDSGSMAQQIAGGRKIDVAKQVFSGLVQDLPSDGQVAVRTYGRQHPSGQRDCADMELMIPFGPNTPARVLPGVKALRPNGMTPIAASLQAAAKDFAGREGQDNIIVLLSDGEEDCNGDPCAAAKAVHDAGIHLQVNVIGLHVQPKERTQLQCVADAGGGKYYDAADAKALKVAASEVKERIVATPAPPPAAPTATATPFVKPAESLYGTPIHGGNSFNDPVELKTGTLYHLDYDQPDGRQDFFKVQVKGGQQLLVTVTGGNAHAIQAEIDDSSRQRQGWPAGAGQRAKAQLSLDVADGKDGWYFVLIGRTGYALTGQDATFQVDLVNQFDANTDRDAGASEDRAVEVKPGVYPQNNMNDADTMDVFKFTAEAGKTYQFKARPAADGAVMTLAAVDRDGVNLGNGQSPNPGAVAKLENLKLAKTGAIFVKVAFDRNYGRPAGDYSFAVGPGDIDSPAKPPMRK
jgi:von Willebrand factor type A domain